MAKRKSTVTTLSEIDGLRSLAEWLGITTFLNVAFAIVGGAMLSIAAYLWDVLPVSVSILLGLIVALVLSSVVERVTRSIANKKMASGPMDADRIKLADECRALSTGMMALISEHQAAIQSAWAADAESFGEGGNRTQLHANAFGKLAEKFGERYAARGWAVIYAASKIIRVSRDDVWGFSHGFRSEHSMLEMAQFLSKIEADLRYGQQEREPSSHPMGRSI